MWNRQRYVKDPATGKRLARLNPPAAWVIEAVPELCIVEAELWAQVQDRLGAIRASAPVAKARAQRFWERRRAKHLLTGKAACGSCGAPFAAVGRDYLACGRAHRQGTCANPRGIRRAVLEDLILEALKQRLMAPELVDAFIAGFHDEVNRQARERDAARTAAAAELAAVGRKLDGVIEALAEGFREHARDRAGELAVEAGARSRRLRESVGCCRRALTRSVRCRFTILVSTSRARVDGVRSDLPYFIWQARVAWPK